MPRYALLVLPATNRVYAEASVDLTRAELGVFSEAVLGGRVGDVAEETLGGVRYVTFAAGSRDGRRFYVVDWNGVSPAAIHAMDVYLDKLLCRR